ncbi:MAG TPA: chaperone modulator CbpM [Anditalea sp.]|nr:chaperone modulator CbpM [Anditalea sp.]
MEYRNLIAIETFCTYHNVENSFIYTVEDAGLIEIILVDDVYFIDEDHLSDLERIVRLYKELDINAEGIGAILQLLDRIDDLQRENDFLKKKLERFIG